MRKAVPETDKVSQKNWQRKIICCFFIQNSCQTLIMKSNSNSLCLLEGETASLKTNIWGFTDFFNSEFLSFVPFKRDWKKCKHLMHETIIWRKNCYNRKLLWPHWIMIRRCKIYFMIFLMDYSKVDEFAVNISISW